jgi:hypothetical protein
MRNSKGCSSLLSRFLGASSRLRSALKGEMWAPEP